MRKDKVLIFIVAYNAEKHIESVLERIPKELMATIDYEILIIDDSSSDNTFGVSNAYKSRSPEYNLKILYNRENLGYGGNQKIGYHYAINNDFTAVVLLHGDGQYAPELLPQMLTPILENDADVVFGSRMINKSNALKGNMPFYKWIGNQILTNVQNFFLNSNLAEFHTGYRAYSVESLKNIPFEYNSDYYDFDTDIIIQCIDTEQRIVEIPIPTFYGEEISYVNGFKYAWLIIRTTILSRIMRLNLFYNPKFDYEGENVHYDLKLGYHSSHQYALDQLSPGMRVLDIASGPGLMAEQIKKYDASVISMDLYIQELARKNSERVIQTDLSHYTWQPDDLKVDLIYLLDIIEHLKNPEDFLSRIRKQMNSELRPSLIITTPNIAFLPIRLSLLFGTFNYGKMGILDKDHSRLFTFSSLKKMLKQTGFEIEELKGIPAPFPKAIGLNFSSKAMLTINKMMIWLFRGAFSYQIAAKVTAKPTIQQLLERAVATEIKSELA